MKENEAPEKIYLCTDGDGIHYYTEGTPSEREYIEYISSDALIKKACEWLKEIFMEYEGLTDYNPMEDFKNHMKGE